MMNEKTEGKSEVHFMEGNCPFVGILSGIAKERGSVVVESAFI